MPRTSKRLHLLVLPAVIIGPIAAAAACTNDHTSTPATANSSASEVGSQCRSSGTAGRLIAAYPTTVGTVSTWRAGPSEPARTLWSKVPTGQPAVWCWYQQDDHPDPTVTVVAVTAGAPPVAFVTGTLKSVPVNPDGPFIP
ncbi:hypothetical protein GCM10011594_40200 [Nakamurella endophytica]|uniref:DUF3515 family protein n=1 Tax=Nakamurella endophytica TaxID=1748367 RepID=A0A917TAK1_9ACTN|nr:hypothetical protein GCM10011594_40200 [Nakamurella endophytica]